MSVHVRLLTILMSLFLAHVSGGHCTWNMPPTGLQTRDRGGMDRGLSCGALAKAAACMIH